MGSSTKLDPAKSTGFDIGHQPHFTDISEDGAVTGFVIFFIVFAIVACLLALKRRL
jgi:hypothetical protein